MGTWSTTIMGGDGPWDAEGDILEMIGFDNQDGDRDHEDHPAEVKSLLEKVSPAAWATFFKDGDCESYTADKIRVAVVLIMANGAALPPALAAAAIDTCAAENLASWGNPEERKFHLDQFVQAIRSYRGIPTTLPSEGLMEKLAVQASPPDKPPRRRMN